METILSPKYQILLPKELRRPLGLKKGQRFQIVAKDGLIILVPEMDIKEMRGWLKGSKTEGLREDKERL
uniref:AbrB/MazE/SpoVT family DNA-binding domain-containing protein n=1 Tax=candidate division WOR-3 bacterium TaxID=2052148 RepID=A0A7V0Z492_UNCW3